MAIKRDEISDPNSCLNRAADDEPVFVLRAKDPLAAKCVRDWAARAVLSGRHDDRAVEAHRFADAMEAWRNKHFSGELAAKRAALAAAEPPLAASFPGAPESASEIPDFLITKKT